MPAKTRHATKYAGVYYIMGKALGSSKSEKIYYIRYRKHEKAVEEKAGRQYQDDMTPARAAGVRAKRIEGAELTNEEQRQAQEAAKHAETQKWTVGKLYLEYMKSRRNNGARKIDEGRYKKYLKELFGDKEPKKIASLEIERLRIKLLKNKSPQTVKNILDLLTWIINYGVIPKSGV